ncbi:MAG: hypothetical protein D6798_10140 [Deltaproteobacteria bacterium]|nr:MAG: hypothetical protein D6798_10140 [Deltaproteobacteria bacterium]
MAAIHANGTGVRHAISRALATQNLAPLDATFRVKRARVDLDDVGEVARAEVSIDILDPARLEGASDAELLGVVNPDGRHPLMVRLPGDGTVPPFYIDILPVSWSRWMEEHEVTLPPGTDRYCPYVGASFEEAQAFAASQGKRLPTEAELRHAWGDRPLPWGDLADPSHGRVGRPRYDVIPENGMHPPTRTGIFDLGAWLWQWLADGRVAGGAPADVSFARPAEGAWPIGIRLVQDA